MKKQQIKTGAVAGMRKVALGLALSASCMGGDLLGGWEARLHAGLELGQTDAVSLVVGGEKQRASMDVESGQLFGAAVGYNWSNGFAAEVEYTYRSADFSTVSAALFPEATAMDIASVLIFANLTYRPLVSKDGALQPFFGLGFGILQEASADVIIGGVEESFDGDGTAFQLLAGFDYRFSERWRARVSAHYYSAGGIDLESGNNAQRKIELDYKGLSLVAGLAFDW
ncbi:MAG: hypothetical protein RLZZ602_631 [Pseudomonadota bacterium]